VEKPFIVTIESERSDQLVSLLKSLNETEKKELVPLIRKLQKEYAAYGATGKDTYGHLKGSDKQREMLQIAAFVCMKRSEYEKSENPTWILSPKKINPILQWYCPLWFSDYLNGLATGEFLSNLISYDWIMDLKQRGLIEPSPELIVRLLPQYIFEEGENYISVYRPQKILKWEETLDVHIWYLFEQESNIHSADRWLRLDPGVSKEDIGWPVLIKQLVQENKLDRGKVLKESLLASNRNFNKVSSGWFAQLFTTLEPSKLELLSLQSELIGVLGAPHSKTVNTALSAIKKIATDKSFDGNVFLDAVPLLLSSETKAVVTATLTILENLIAAHIDLKERILISVTQCFIHNDEALQVKAAKLISKFGNEYQEAVSSALEAYQPNLLNSSRQVLKTFIDDQLLPVAENPVDQFQPEIRQSAFAELPFPVTLDDLIFLASQAFDNNESWHIDVLPAALIQFSGKITAAQLILFEPAIQRSFAWRKSGLSSSMGNLDHLLSLFFIDFMNIMLQQHPASKTSIENIFRKYDITEGPNTNSFLVPPDSGAYTSEFSPYNKVVFYEPYRQILLTALQKIKLKDDLPLLSTPSHLPFWISPEVLIERLARYEKANRKPDEMDLQVAISRCVLDYNTETIEKIYTSLNGEWKNLLYFLLDENAEPIGPFQYKAAWMTAALTRKNKKEWPVFQSFSYAKIPIQQYTGELEWRTFEDQYKSSEYDYTLKKSVEVIRQHKIIKVERQKEISPETGIKKIIGFFQRKPKEDTPMLYDFMHFELTFFSEEGNDFRRVLSLIPNNPEPLIADTINHCLEYSTVSSEGDRKIITVAAQFLYETWNRPGKMAQLFLATCMLNSDKTIIGIASETWLRAVAEKNIDQQQIGKNIGIHERIEFAPLKRLTDLMSQALYKVSPLHDQQLQVMTEWILPQLPDEPIKNLKKLLEIYAELRAINNAQHLRPAVSERLKVWLNNPGLNKIVKRIIS
jgi:Family of unknown function (DUF6493)